MTEDNNKVTIILALGLIAVALGLLYILNKTIKNQQSLNLNNKFNGLNNLSDINNSNNTSQNYNNNNRLWNIIRDDNGKLIDIEMIKTPQ